MIFWAFKLAGNGLDDGDSLRIHVDVCLFSCTLVPTHRSTQLHRKKKMKQRSRGAQTEIIIDLIT